MSQKPKILIVDDRQENLVALRTILSEINADVIEATNGNDALTATLNHHFALAILDVQMPGMDGYELAYFMQKDSSTDKIPVIFLTANYSEEDKISKGYERGAVDYLIKPYDPFILLSKVSVFLTLFQQRLELKHYSEKLEAANKELEAFSYSVSHDLRAPLRAVNGYTKILLNDYGKYLDEEGLRVCSIISTSASQMSNLIDNLLSFSRIGRSSINPGMLDMKIIVASTYKEITTDAEKMRINLKIAKLHKTFGDANLIKMVWNNLISNAIKYSSKKEISEISVGSRVLGDMIIYQIKDNGVGFEMLYKHKLFGVFQRLHSEIEFEGNGVGLAIVQRIINMHGGKVWAEGEVGKGATFYFSLPASEVISKE
jgi:two-component system sensor histidine kinase/response regulator